MSTAVSEARVVRAPDTARTALRRARAALFLGIVAAITLAATDLFVATTPDQQGKFQHAGDYVLTADGIPYMLGLLALLPALRTLQSRRDGRRGRAGVVVAGLGALVLLGIFAYGLAAATASSIGPLYVIGSFATIVGVALFAAGSWRIGLFPRWLLALWAFAWIVGSALPIPGPWPLLLAAVYATMALLLPGRVASTSRSSSSAVSSGWVSGR